jgi:uncharacterized protein (UPF0262 family)
VTGDDPVDKANGLAFGAVWLTKPFVPDARLIDIILDEHTILWRSAEIEQERRIAIFDLIEGNMFAPIRAMEQGHGGPYRLTVAVNDGRLSFSISDEQGSPLETIIMALGRFRRRFKDYFAICDSYYSAIKSGGASAAQIETIDMARRGVHNDGANLLKDALAGKIDIDFDTARRLFTLICVLHIKG